MAERIDYDEWLAEFTKDKKEIGTFDQSTTHAVHTVRRYLDGDNHIWEIAFTYTGRLVVRSGPIEPDGVSVKWGNWVTRHDVQIPRQR